jgi:hypothetical protein
MASYTDSAVTSIACAISFRSWATTVEALRARMAIYHIRYLFVYSTLHRHVVMSSCVCKKLEGAIFPLQVKSLEDGIDDAVHALNIHKTDHGPGPPPDFDETTFDDVGSAQLTP